MVFSLTFTVLLAALAFAQQGQPPPTASPMEHLGKEQRSMPAKSTVGRAEEDLHEGKSATTAAGEWYTRRLKHVRQGKHGARSPQQAIVIGLSKARRAEFRR